MCVYAVFSAHTFRRGAPPRLSAGPPPPATLWKLRNAFLERPPRLNVGGSEHFFFLQQKGNFCAAVEQSSELQIFAKDAIVERSLLFSWFLTSFSVQACRSITCDNNCFETENSTSTLCSLWVRSRVHKYSWSDPWPCANLITCTSEACHRSWALCRCVFFLAFWERKGVRQARERRRNKWRS